jgi:thiol-disulfide isomerase/thioredoxin
MKNLIKIFTLIISIVILASYKDNSETPLSVLTKVKEKYESHKSISYYAKFGQKYLNDDDTTRIEGKCSLFRDLSDSLFAGKVWLTYNDSSETIYNKENTYYINHKTKKITEYNEPFIISGNIYGNLMETYFLDVLRLQKLASKDENKSLLIENKNDFIITIKFPDDDGVSERELTLTINKKSYIIERITYRVIFQGNVQFSECDLSNVIFDNKTNEGLENYLIKYKNDYENDKYVPRSEEDYKLIDNGTEAPNFIGENFTTKSKVSLSDYRGKLVLLDFYYMSCLPCIKAIPYLSKFQEKYKDDLVVLGINSADNDENDKKKLPTFFEKNAMNYTTILTTRKTDSLYNVLAYPTLYLLDREGKVIHSDMGFSEENMNSLDSIISINIK